MQELACWRVVTESITCIEAALLVEEQFKSITLEIVVTRECIAYVKIIKPVARVV